MEDQDKGSASHMVCGNCPSTLESWYRGEKLKLKFGMKNLEESNRSHLQPLHFYDGSYWSG